MIYFVFNWKLVRLITYSSRYQDSCPIYKYCFIFQYICIGTASHSTWRTPPCDDTGLNTSQFIAHLERRGMGDGIVTFTLFLCSQLLICINTEKTEWLCSLSSYERCCKAIRCKEKLCFLKSSANQKTGLFKMGWIGAEKYNKKNLGFFLFFSLKPTFTPRFHKGELLEFVLYQFQTKKYWTGLSNTDFKCHDL